MIELCHTPDGQVRLAHALRRTGGCVSQLGLKVLDLERQILDSDGRLNALSDATEGLQALDFLKQATDDIAELLDRMADATPASATFVCAEVFKPMKIQELRDAIACDNPTPRQEGSRSSSQKIELF